MADKVERLKTTNLRTQGKWRASGTLTAQGYGIASERGYAIGYLFGDGDVKDVVALHNAALDINPSNPMAVAEALQKNKHYSKDWDVVWFKKYGIKIEPTHKSYLTGSKSLAEGYMVFIPAAITKPATKEVK